MSGLLPPELCRHTLAHQLQELGGAVALLLRPLVQMIERLLCRFPGGATVKPATVRRCPWCGEVVPRD